MPDTDDLTVTAELRQLQASVAELDVIAPPQLAAITARGRARRRHRRYALVGLSLAGAAAATAVTLGMTGVPGSAPADTVTAGSRTPPAIRTAAFTLVSNSDGTVMLTIDPRELLDTTALENDLAQYGIPALITTGKFCSSDPAPADVDQAVSYQPATHAGGDGTITIDPAALPAGTELSFGTVGLRDGVVAAYTTLIDPNAYTCSDTMPTDTAQDSHRQGFIMYGPPK